MAASQSILEIIIQAVDESAAALQGAQNNLKQVGQSAIGTGAQIALAGAAILAPLGLSVQAAETSQKVQAQLGAVLKSTAEAAGVTSDSALDLSKALEHQTTYSDEAVLSVENMLLTFTNIKDNVFPDATKAVLDMATALGQDSKDSAIQLGKALQDPVLGVTALRRVGVAFDEDQRKLIETLVKSGDTLGAQKLILKEVTTEFGGSAAAAAGTFGGRVEQLNEKFDDMKETIGGALIPVLLNLVSAIAPIVDKVTAWMEEHPKLTQIIVVFVAVLGGLLLVIGSLLVAFGTLAVTIALLGAPFTLIIGLIAVLAALVIANWQSLADDMKAIWQVVQSFFTAAWTWMKNLFNTSLKAVQNEWNTVWTDMSNFIQGIWDTIKNIVKTGVNDVITVINAFINALDAIHINLPSISIPGTKLSTPAVNLGFNIPDIPMLASGGFVTSPTLALIGEAGPEPVIPLSKMSSAPGGTMITVNIQGGIFPADQSAVKQIGDLIAKTINQQLKLRNYAL